MSAKVQIECQDDNCGCVVSWIETDDAGNRFICIGGKHHGQKHVSRFSESEFLEKIKEAR